MQQPSLAIETSLLTRQFGSLLAVDHIGLKVPVGSVYGFLGLNGAGKTTTIRMLLGLISADEGQIKLFGKTFENQQRERFNNIGALVESPSLYLHLTGYENLELTRTLIDAKQEQIDRVLKIVGLEKDAKRIVRGYSMGMKQRLALALALLNNPKLLILDEPTNGLDPAGIREMRALITRLSTEEGITIFLSSHLLSEIEQVATYIGIIHQGRLLFQDTLSELHAQINEHIGIEVDKPVDAQKLLSGAGWDIQRNGSERLVVASHQREDVAKINTQIVNAGISVFHIGLEQPSLEDIFLKFTSNQIQGDPL
jgi:ABC-2 type transport system ATP-binding protein